LILSNALTNPAAGKRRLRAAWNAFAVPVHYPGTSNIGVLS
jgi:hypothetical protein